MRWQGKQSKKKKTTTWISRKSLSPPLKNSILPSSLPGVLKWQQLWVHQLQYITKVILTKSKKRNANCTFALQSGALGHQLSCHILQTLQCWDNKGLLWLVPITESIRHGEDAWRAITPCQIVSMAHLASIQHKKSGTLQSQWVHVPEQRTLKSLPRNSTFTPQSRCDQPWEKRWCQNTQRSQPNTCSKWNEFENVFLCVQLNGICMALFQGQLIYYLLTLNEPQISVYQNVQH